VTRGPRGALVRGRIVAEAPGVAASVVDTTGAGDVLMGVLLARLADRSFEAEALAHELPAAVEAASRSTEGWGAVDALPLLGRRA
jgi:sugar/nucleoside kinase (ribokinase family)